MDGVWNERLGWLLLLVGFLTAVGLDPWSLSERDPAALPGSARMATRYAQGVVLAMGFLQIAVALLLREDALSAGLRRVAGLVRTIQRQVFVVVAAGKSAHGDLLTADGQPIGGEGEVLPLERDRRSPRGGGSTQDGLGRGCVAARLPAALRLRSGPGRDERERPVVPGQLRGVHRTVPRRPSHHPRP